MNEGISELESIEILKLDPFTEIGTPTKLLSPLEVEISIFKQ